MPRTPTRLAGPLLLSGATVTRYTVGTGKLAIVRHIHIANVTASAATLTLSVGADGTGTQLFTAKSIPANDVYDFYCYIIMAAAEFIAAHSGTASALNLTINGDEATLG